MVITKDTALPSYEELTVPQEITLSSPYLKAVIPYMAYSCQDETKEFMLKRKEYEDPRKTLKEGAAVTACGVKFLQSLKRTCKAETDQYANCIDKSSAETYTTYCRQEQLVLDSCVEDKLGIKRPKRGYFSKLHVHVPKFDPPQRVQRDYKAEAAQVIAELPPDAKELNRKDFKNFNEWGKDFLRA
ncbi:unnamed protein product [Bursaphelenchus okinawaensis]|uniref:NADH dehydrogenase [ubiquinone] 1 alpha subcomplex subunit 8 n=1 Tax=Bursaphelenchus okinawaensis TaxID=465554 RepID=A0A811KIX7_9BILA|nr:unnamed protein product [Bursaphelenchus okinawaensis]CAG9104144.1 unnamed protein product [Bursaphelenchus okinawaensis]